MYLQDYLVFLVAVLACSLFAMIASGKVRRAYSEYSDVPSMSGASGYDVAMRLMRQNGVNDIDVDCIDGELTDHYSPADGIVNLSSGTYHGRTIAAAAVAAHEIGHVMQRETGYAPYRWRTALVPIVNFGSRLSMPLVFIGILLDSFARSVSPDLGFHVAMIGVILYGGSFLFALVTLPVELDASRRAGNMLVDAGIVARDELPGVRKVLSAAALTYVASLLTSLVYFLRFLVYVLSIFGRRDSRRR